VLLYWDGDDLVFETYAPPLTRVSATAVTFDILKLYDRWRPAEALFRHMPQFSRSSLQKTLNELVKNFLLNCSRSSSRGEGEPSSGWESWNPWAGLLHFQTKDVPFDTDLDQTFEDLRRRAEAAPPPPPIKEYSRSRCWVLPEPPVLTEFPRVLLARRTWRRFSRASLRMSDLGTLLGLTWGVQRWLKAPGIGRYPLKTSPSSGALHPIEAYVLAARVTGLPRGLYHYNSQHHRLELLRKGATPARIETYLAGQWWFRSAAALILMTAVFPRTQWKYETARAYRAVLTESGHLCQTFCLVATWLKLAPFCTLALADSRIEKDLGVDGVHESILYAAGVGVRPSHGTWSPVPAPR
jgi:SagB-type dehydrogenase family enzyme